MKKYSSQVEKIVPLVEALTTKTIKYLKRNIDEMDLSQDEGIAVAVGCLHELLVSLMVSVSPDEKGLEDLKQIVIEDLVEALESHKQQRWGKQ